MRILRSWKDLSVSIKLYMLVGVMGLLIATELLTLRFAMNTLSSVRAFVGGEGLWSKAQKTSIIALQKYIETADEKDFQEFNVALAVPMGDRAARIEMMKPEPDQQKIFNGFLQGKVHADDIPGLVNLVTRFYWVPHLARALEVWSAGDDGITVLMTEAEKLHVLVSQRKPRRQIDAQMERIKAHNDALTVIEDDFSRILGEGSRWLEGMVMTILLMLVLTVESTGILLTVSFSRNLSRTLKDMIDVAKSVGQGDFSKRSKVESGDELGQLATALNAMTASLQENVGSRKLAEEASQTKSAFLANMSHEIRTPLGAILGFTEILKDPSLSAHDRESYLATIQRNGEALTKVINDILDLSKVEAGGVAVEYLDFFLPGVLQDVVDLFAANAADKHIALNLTIDPSAKISVKSDPTRIKQILFNIIGNAIKFTEHGSVSIHASVGDDTIKIRVRDTGLGITDTQRTKLFAPFTQADSSTSRKFGGTGLGLALSRKLAEALGGTVYIQTSKASGGSTFVIEIENRRADSNKSSAPFADSAPMRSVAGARVLVVDDSPDNRQLLKIFLNRHGVQAEFATNGREAVNAATSSDFDVVLMDIQMPEMDGYTALKELQRLSYKKPVIAFTAHAMKEEREQCLSVGFVAHISKPVNEKLLINTVSSFL